jgi:hypothetical protein
MRPNLVLKLTFDMSRVQMTMKMKTKRLAAFSRLWVFLYCSKERGTQRESVCVRVWIMHQDRKKQKENSAPARKLSRMYLQR